MYQFMTLSFGKFLNFSKCYIGENFHKGPVEIVFLKFYSFTCEVWTCLYHIINFGQMNQDQEMMFVLLVTFHSKYLVCRGQLILSPTWFTGFFAGFIYFIKQCISMLYLNKLYANDTLNEYNYYILMFTV